MRDASGKTVLVTGASRGIGRAIAQRFVSLGARVAITGRDPDRLEKARRELAQHGIDPLAYAADAAEPRKADEVVERCQHDLGPIDLLVNNAGIAEDEGPPGQWDLNRMWKVFETNLRGPMAYANAVLKTMMPRNTGTIVNMGSYAAILPRDAWLAYPTSKAALARFSDCLDAALTKTNIAVFTISPGLVRTDMTDRIDLFDDVPEAYWAKPDDAASLVARLFLEDFSCLRGRFLHVNDDLDRLAREAQRIENEGLYQLRLPGLDGLIR